MTMKNILNGKVLIAALVIAIVLSCASLAYILVIRPAAVAPDLTPASAILTVIPAPTSTLRTVLPMLMPIPPTMVPTPTLGAGEIGIGIYVQVATGGGALRVRPEPGLNTEPLFLAFDSEAFLVTDGPEQVDGYIWWYLTASYDASRAGWAVQDYLTVIPEP